MSHTTSMLTPGRARITVVAAERTNSRRLRWQDDALCAETDPDMFSPEKGGSTVAAKKVCAGCTVREQCLEFALANDLRDSVYGGLSPAQRRNLQAKRATA